MSRSHKTIPMTAHTLTYVAEVPATTSAEGTKAHYTCSVCGKLFSDATGSVEVTAAELVIPKLTEGQKIYLKPGEWANDNARLAVWVSGWKNYTSEWYALESLGNGIYVADVGSTAWASCKFARFDPTTTGYDTAWNTSSEVGFQAGYLYTIPAGSWDNAVPTSAVYDPDATEPPTPVSSVTLTLVPGVWNAGVERMAAYFYGDNGDTWVDMTKSGDNYTVAVPEGYTSVIFCRMNGETTENNWDNKWNQTEDLTVPSANATYTITGWGGEKSTGTW